MLIFGYGCSTPLNELYLMEYAGTVMTSFDHVLIPTRGNWFQTGGGTPIETLYGDVLPKWVGF